MMVTPEKPRYLHDFTAPPFSILICTACKASSRFDGDGHAVGAGIRYPCECGSNQFIMLAD